MNSLSHKKFEASPGYRKPCLHEEWGKRQKKKKQRKLFERVVILTMVEVRQGEKKVQVFTQ